MSILCKDLRIAIPIKAKEITSVKITQKCNEHAIAEITIILQDGQKLEDIYAMNEQTNITLFHKNSDKKPILFSGTLMHLQIYMLQDICTVKLTAKSYTALLDITSKKRSFQNKNNTYQSIFKQIIQTEYNGDFIDTASNGKTQNRVIIQYDETDWAFLLRLASQLNTVVIADILSDMPKLYIGLPTGESHEQKAYHYKITRQIDKYMLQKQNYDEKSLLDFTYLDIETDQEYMLGDTIQYQNTSFIIMEKEMELYQGKMLCKYKICKKEGIFTNIFYNDIFTGLSIDGKVIDVYKDYLKLHLCIDKTANVSESHWFQYNTPYTAEGQTGFYIMPQVGDSVKLYSPNCDESQCYVRAVNRISKNTNNKTKDNTIKRFGTIHQNEMVLSPNSIEFNTTQKKCYMNMNYSNGITLAGSAGIKINTDNSMGLEANKIIINAGDRIIATTPKANVIVDDILHFKA